MKSYTDIEQARKLAEILPIESADMFYSVNSPYDETEEEWKVQIGKMPKLRAIYRKYCPCWSLAALLEFITEPVLTYIDKNNWNISTFKDNHFKDEVISNNPVDACVEMIIKLHEQNLL